MTEVSKSMKVLYRFTALMLVACALLIAPISAIAQSKTLVWQRLDSDITVQPNGDLRIIETNVIRFTSGSFTFGYRDIKQDRLTEISDIEVTEGVENGVPLRFETTQTDTGDFRIKYYLATPAQNETRTLRMAYTVKGATRYYPDGDQVYWAGVYASRNGFSVSNSTITLRLPAGTKATKAETYGPRANVNDTREGNVIVAEATEPIPSGTEFELRVQFPHGVISGQAPVWQKAFDTQRSYDETVKPRNDLLTLLGSLVLLLGGPALAAVVWVTKGRDPNVGLIAEYLNEPPNIPPGLAGTLVDEKADMQDVIATFVDLARRGVITMREIDDKNDAIFGSRVDYMIAAGPKLAELRSTLKPYEMTLLDNLDIAADERKLSTLKAKFYKYIPQIKKQLYEQLIKEGYYDHSPEAVRTQWSGLGIAMFVLAFVVGCGAMTVLANLTSYAFCVPIGFIATAITFFAIAGAMPVRTRPGAEARMRLEAFKRYLQNIEKYVNLKEATDQFDKYLPYAVAFGLDRSWVNKFSKVETPSPGWYIPYGYGYGPHYGNYGGGRRSIGTESPAQSAGSRGDIGGAARAPTNIEGLNTGLAVGLAGINQNLTGMFSSVANTLSSQPAPTPSSSSSSGSWSGGGGSWSGGGGGGGGSSGGGGGGFG